MNKVVLMGRIANELELKSTQSGYDVLSFTIAVPRRMKPETTDFIRCTAWSKTAEFISKYFAKGRMIAVEGEIQVRTWDGTDNKKHSATEVCVSGAYFTGEKKADNNTNDAPSGFDIEGFNDEFADLIDDDDDVPF